MMRHLALALLMVLLLWAEALGQGSSAICRSVEELGLPDPDREGMTLTTPPYVALADARRLRRPSRIDTPLSAEETSCLKSLVGVELTALRAGSSFRFRIQTPTGSWLVFHVADLVGGEAVVPSPADRLLANARRFLREGNRSEAARAFRAVVGGRARPQQKAFALTELGRMAREEGRLDEALQRFREALAWKPQFVPALKELGSLSLRLGLEDEARQIYKRLLRLTPSDPKPYMALIRLAHRLGDRQEMLRLYRRLQAVNRQAASKLAREIPPLRGLEPAKLPSPKAKETTEIPLKIGPGGVLLAEVSVNGSEPLKFIVDTGASIVSLKRATAERLDIGIDPDKRVTIKTASGTKESPALSIETIEIQGIEAENIEGAILEEDFGPGIEGLLGQSFLKKINARIDMVRGVMIVEKP